MLVDSHCHLDRLDLSPWGGDLSALLNSTREGGVGHMLCVCIDMENAEAVRQIATHYDFVSASVGVHPNEQGGVEPDEATLVELARAPEIVAIGETGLDYFRSEGDLEWQRDRFRRHIRAARAVRKPLIIHMREATDDTLRILREEGADEIGGVMHCFVENWEIARKALDLNFDISFSGIVTFKSATDLQDVARRLPSQRMLVETDAPYLAPVPYRGKPNYPGYVRNVASCIAELRGVTAEEIAEQTTQNFFRRFPAARDAQSTA